MARDPNEVEDIDLELPEEVPRVRARPNPPEEVKQPDSVMHNPER